MNSIKSFWRIANQKTKQGLWYDQKGNFTGLIHSKYNFCKNSTLEMPFEKDVVGWLSATQTLEELFQWFPKEDIEKLQKDGFFITLYLSRSYKFHNNHWLIEQDNSISIGSFPLHKLPKTILYQK